MKMLDNSKKSFGSTLVGTLAWSGASHWSGTAFKAALTAVRANMWAFMKAAVVLSAS